MKIQSDQDGESSFTLEQRPGATIIHVVGDIDMFSGPDLERALALAEAHHGERVIVTLEKCLYCDSTCVSIVLRAWHRIGSRFSLVVTAHSNVWRVFEITGVTTMSFIVPTIDEALRLVIEG